MPVVKRVGKGKYLVRVFKGTGALRQAHNKTLKCTLAEATQYAREIESQLSRGRSPHSLKSLLKYSEYWRSRISVKPSTDSFYESIIRLYAVPLHDMPMFKIADRHIQLVYDKLTVSPNTVNHLHSTLRAMFRFAVKKKHLVDNPVSFVDPPKKTKPEVDHWNEQDAMRFMAALPNAPHGLVFEMALETGMRPGEYLALRKADIVFGSASITRSVSRDGLTFGDPKTKASRRLVPLSEPLLERIQSHLENQPHELLFSTSLGTPLSQSNLQKEMNRIIKKTKIKSISLYGLRHTMATLMLLGGENPKVVSERLGHASVTITLDTYSHVLSGIQEAATDRLSAMLRGAHNTRIQNLESADLIN